MTHGDGKTTHFDITADVANSPKPPWANFRGASKGCCQGIIRHDTRESRKPANSVKEKGEIRSYLIGVSGFKPIYAQVNVLCTFVAKSDL